ncbi:hypothetical protein AVEN_186664-1, partial [Araneus ventricosus]
MYTTYSTAKSDISQQKLSTAHDMLSLNAVNVLHHQDRFWTSSIPEGKRRMKNEGWTGTDEGCSGRDEGWTGRDEGWT